MGQVSWLDTNDLSFPDSREALAEPNGLLAVGGDLRPERLLKAYSQGIFPWYSDDQPILWWSPSPRMILLPDELHLGRSLRKLANKRLFHIRVDSQFDRVISYCATAPREGTQGTWITEDMRAAYSALHRLGYAHCIEAWQDNQLVGGLYGIALGRVFFGESMFSLVSGASKIAFATMVRQLQAWDFQLIDCQMFTHYLASFGAKEVERDEFERRLKNALPSNIDNMIAHPSEQVSEHRQWHRMWTQGDYGLG